MKRNATEFKAKCLSLIDEVFRTGKTVVITKRGRIVAKLVRASENDTRDPRRSLEGSGRELGDIVAPMLDASDWNAERGVL